MASLKDVSHIRSGRAYFFTDARSIVLMRLRRARIVSIESVTEIESLHIVGDEPSPERIAAGRRELDRVRRLIEGLPERRTDEHTSDLQSLMTISYALILCKKKN